MLPPHQPIKRRKIAKDAPVRFAPPKPGAKAATTPPRPSLRVLGRKADASPVVTARQKRIGTC